MVRISKSKILVALLFLFSITSCDSNGVFDKYVSLDNDVWKKENIVEFSFEVKDTITQHNLFLNLRNNNNYEFSNLFLITELNFPNGEKVVDTLEYQMADATGKFLGQGFSEIKENKLYYKEQKRFPMSGNYSVNVRHAMRVNGEVDGVEELLGITDVGFRIEKN